MAEPKPKKQSLFSQRRELAKKLKEVPCELSSSTGLPPVFSVDSNQEYKSEINLLGSSNPNQTPEQKKEESSFQALEGNVGPFLKSQDLKLALEAERISQENEEYLRSIPKETLEQMAKLIQKQFSEDSKPKNEPNAVSFKEVSAIYPEAFGNPTEKTEKSKKDLTLTYHFLTRVFFDNKGHQKNEKEDMEVHLNPLNPRMNNEFHSISEGIFLMRLDNPVQPLFFIEKLLKILNETLWPRSDFFSVHFEKEEEAGKERKDEELLRAKEAGVESVLKEEEVLNEKDSKTQNKKVVLSTQSVFATMAELNLVENLIDASRLPSKVLVFHYSVSILSGLIETLFPDLQLLPYLNISYKKYLKIPQNQKEEENPNSFGHRLGELIEKIEQVPVLIKDDTGYLALKSKLDLLKREMDRFSIPAPLLDAEGLEKLIEASVLSLKPSRTSLLFEDFEAIGEQKEYEEFLEILHDYGITPLGSTMLNFLRAIYDLDLLNVRKCMKSLSLISVLLKKTPKGQIDHFIPVRFRLIDALQFTRSFLKVKLDRIGENAGLFKEMSEVIEQVDILKEYLAFDDSQPLRNYPLTKRSIESFEISMVPYILIELVLEIYTEEADFLKYKEQFPVILQSLFREINFGSFMRVMEVSSGFETLRECLENYSFQSFADETFTRVILAIGSNRLKSKELTFQLWMETVKPMESLFEKVAKEKEFFLPKDFYEFPIGHGQGTGGYFRSEFIKKITQKK